MTKDELIDLLIENQPTVLEIVNKVNQRLISLDVGIFFEEYKEQWYSLIKLELANELYNKGLTMSLLYDTIDTDELGLFIEEVLKNERDQ